jgi:hypothetical protein
VESELQRLIREQDRAHEIFLKKPLTREEIEAAIGPPPPLGPLPPLIRIRPPEDSMFLLFPYWR